MKILMQNLMEIPFFYMVNSQKSLNLQRFRKVLSSGANTYHMFVCAQKNDMSYYGCFKC